MVRIVYFSPYKLYLTNLDPSQTTSTCTNPPCHLTHITAGYPRSPVSMLACLLLWTRAVSKHQILMFARRLPCATLLDTIRTQGYEAARCCGSRHRLLSSSLPTHIFRLSSSSTAWIQDDYIELYQESDSGEG